VLPQFAGVVITSLCDAVRIPNGYGLGIGIAPGFVGNHLLEEVNCEAVDGGFTFESTNAWHHVGLVRQNGNDYFYGDGQLVTVQQTPTPNPSGLFWIGAFPGLAHFFDGYIDDVRVYARALTSTEVQQLYQYEAVLSLLPTLEVTRSESNIILSWPTTYAGFDYSGFSLKSTTNLASPIWTTNSPPPVVIHGQYTVTNPISGTQQIFRLSQ